MGTQVFFCSVKDFGSCVKNYPCGVPVYLSIYPCPSQLIVIRLMLTIKQISWSKLKKSSRDFRNPFYRIFSPSFYMAHRGVQETIHYH